MKMQLQQIVERTVMRLAGMPASQPPALLFPRNFNERERENERRRAVRAAREHVAADAIIAMKAEVPEHWPKWNSENWENAEMEFKAFANWCGRMAELDRQHARAAQVS